MSKKKMAVEDALSRIREFNFKTEATVLEKELNRLREIEWRMEELEK